MLNSAFCTQSLLNLFAVRRTLAARKEPELLTRQSNQIATSLTAALLWEKKLPAVLDFCTV